MYNFKIKDIEIIDARVMKTYLIEIWDFIVVFDEFTFYKKRVFLYFNNLMIHSKVQLFNYIEKFFIFNINFENKMYSNQNI